MTIQGRNCDSTNAQVHVLRFFFTQIKLFLFKIRFKIHLFNTIDSKTQSSQVLI